MCIELSWVGPRAVSNQRADIADSFVGVSVGRIRRAGLSHVAYWSLGNVDFILGGMCLQLNLSAPCPELSAPPLVKVWWSPGTSALVRSRWCGVGVKMI